MDEIQRISRRSLLVLGGGAALGGLAGTAEADDLMEARPGHRLVVVTANIGRKHLDQRRPAIRKVRESAHRPLVGWQEIGEGEKDVGEKPMIEHFFGPAYRNVGMVGKVPVSVPHPWKVTKWWRTFASSGLAGWSPTRFITEVFIEHVDQPQLRFSFLDTHYIANAWAGKTDDKQDDRRHRWNHHLAVHRRRVQAHRDRGRTVIWTGDVNNKQMPAVHRLERKAFHHGIDKVNWVPGTDRVRINLLRTQIIPLHVDGHDAKLAVFNLRLA